MILPLPCTLPFAALSLCLAHHLCFVTKEGNNEGKEDSKDDAVKSDLDKDGIVFVTGKGFCLFFIYNEVFQPPPVSHTVHSLEECAGLVLLNCSAQEPKVTSKGQKHFLHL